MIVSWLRSSTRDEAIRPVWSGRSAACGPKGGLSGGTVSIADLRHSVYEHSGACRARFPLLAGRAAAYRARAIETGPRTRETL